MSDSGVVSYFMKLRGVIISFRGVLNNLIKRNYFRDLHFKELIIGSSTSLILSMVSYLISYTTTFTIARYYGAGVLGIFSLSIAFLSIASIFSKLGFDSSLIKFVALYSSQKRDYLISIVHKKVQRLVIINGFIINGVLFFLSPSIAKYLFNKEYLSVYFQIISFSTVPMAILALNSASFRGLRKIKEFTFFQEISVRLFSLFILLTFIVFSSFSDEAMAPVVSFFIGSLLAVLLSQYAWMQFSKSITENNQRENVGTIGLLKVSTSMMLSSSIFLIMQWTATLLLGALGTEEDVGVYNVAIKLSTLTGIFLVAANSISAPKFAEFYARHDIKGLSVFVRQSTKLIFWSSVPILVLIMIFPSFFLRLFGEDFEIGITAMIILLVGQFINGISGSVGYLLQMTGKQNIFQIILFFALIINIILNALLIPLYGITGAAIATAVSTVFWNMASIIYIKLKFNFVTFYIPFITK